MPVPQAFDSADSAPGLATPVLVAFGEAGAGGAGGLPPLERLVELLALQLGRRPLQINPALAPDLALAALAAATRSPAQHGDPAAIPSPDGGAEAGGGEGGEGGGSGGGSSDDSRDSNGAQASSTSTITSGSGSGSGSSDRSREDGNSDANVNINVNINVNVNNNSNSGNADANANANGSGGNVNSSGGNDDCRATRSPGGINNINANSSGSLACLPFDVGLPLADGRCWAEVLGAWRQPCLLVLSAAQLRTGLPAAGCALLRQGRVPLLGLLQWGDPWDQQARRRDGLPWLGLLRDPEAGDAPIAPARQEEQLQAQLGLAAALARRWQQLRLA